MISNGIDNYVAEQCDTGISFIVKEAANANKKVSRVTEILNQYQKFSKDSRNFIVVKQEILKACIEYAEMNG